MPFFSRKPTVLQPGKTSTTKPKIPMCTKRKLNTLTHGTLKKQKPTEEPHKKFALYAQNTVRRMKAWNPPRTTNVLVQSRDQKKASTVKEDDKSTIAQADRAFSEKLEPANDQETEKISPENQLQLEVNDSEIPNINKHSIKSTELDINCSGIGDVKQSESKDQQEAFNCMEKESESLLTTSEREKSKEITVESQGEKICNQMLDLVSVYDHEEPSRDSNSVRSSIISEFPGQIDKKIEIVGKAENLPEIVEAENMKKTEINFVATSSTAENDYGNEHLKTSQNEEPSCSDLTHEEFSQNKVHSETLGNRGLNKETKDSGVQNICDPKGDDWLDEKTQVVGNKSSEELSSDDDLNDIVSKSIEKYMNKETLAKQVEEMLARGKSELSQETVIVSPQKLNPRKSSFKKQRLKNSIRKKGKQNKNKKFTSKCSRQDNNFATKACDQSRKVETQEFHDITKDSETICDFRKSNVDVPPDGGSETKFNSDETMILDSPTEYNSTAPTQNLNYAPEKNESRLTGEKLEPENASQKIDIENKDVARFNLHEIPMENFSNRGDEMVENSMQRNITIDTMIDGQKYFKTIDGLAGMSLKAGDEKSEEGMKVIESNLQTDDYISKFQDDNEDDLFLQVEENQVEPFDTQQKYRGAKSGEASNFGSPLSIFEESFCSPEANLLSPNSPCLDAGNCQVWDRAADKNFEERSIINRSLQNNIKADETVLPMTDMKNNNNNSVPFRKPTWLVPVSTAVKQNFGAPIRTCLQRNQTGRATEETFKTFNDLYIHNKFLIDGGFNSVSNKNGELPVCHAILKKDAPARKFNQQLQASENYFHNTSYAGAFGAQILPAELNTCYPEQGSSKKTDITTQPNKQKFKEKLQFLKGVMDQNKLRREKKIDEIRELVFDTK